MRIYNGKLFMNWRYLIQKFYLSVRRNGIIPTIRKSGKYIRKKFKKINKTPLVESYPLVSILIPVLNGKDYFDLCLCSLIDSINEMPFEVIIIDQGSTDGTLEMVKKFIQGNPNIILIENALNLGFAKAINQGAEIARGKYLVIANSDLIFSKGWLFPLVKCATEDYSIGVVSPLTNFVGEGKQIDIDAVNIKINEIDEYANKIKNRDCITFIPDRLVFFCVLIPKNIFHLIGGLDEIYDLGNYEDDDFCLRARLNGFHLAICNNSFVYHHGSKTFKNQKIDYKSLMQRNEKIFYSRVYEFATNPTLMKYKQSKQNEISVIVRTKDRSHLLKQCLFSLLNQTYQNFEVIIVNDGEVDVVLDKGFYNSLNIKTVLGKKRGRSAALNTGLMESTGEFICYLDDDDIFYPFHLELMIENIKHNPEVVLLYSDTNKSLCWEKNDLIIPVERERFNNKEFNYFDLQVENWIPLISVIHRKNVINKVGLFDESLLMFEDWDLFLRLASIGKIKRLPKITNEYRFIASEKTIDSTLLQREIAVEYKKQIYKKYPIESEEIVRQRELSIQESILQVRWLRSKKDQISTYDIAKFLAGFQF